MKRKPLSPPSPTAAQEPDKYADQFRAVVHHEGCETCERGKVWEVVGMDGAKAKRFRGEKGEDEAEELAYYMSRAFERGVAAAKKEGRS